MENIIEFKKLTKYYNTFKALNELSFSVKKKSCTALVGNNGCGKTTTVMVLCNLINYDEGELFVKNKLVYTNYTSYKKSLGMILSKPYYIEEFSIIEYLRFICRYQNVKKEEISTRINDIISILKIDLRNNLPIKDLSAGNQMKISIAAALIHNPELLVLDEPFLNLDIGTVELFKTILLQLKDKKTIFITSHNLDLIADICDNFLIMDKGSIIAEIKKSSYSDVGELKYKILGMLSMENHDSNLEWLQ